jgi:hypothetical protein
MRLFDKTSVLLLSVVIGAGITYAQAPDPAAPPPDGGVTVSGSLSVKLSVNEMSARAASFETQTQDDLRHLIHLQAIARREKDVIKLNCINDKLVQMKAQLNIFGSFYGQLTASLGRTDSDERHTVFVNVSESADAIKRLRAEADVCAGEVDLKIESSALVDRPELPDDPTTWDPNYDPIPDNVEPPGYASPYK